MLEWYYWKTDDFFTNGNFHNVLIGSFPGGDSSWCSTWTESPENSARTSSPLCCCPRPCPWSPTLHPRLDLGKKLFREVFTGEVLPSTRLTLWDQQPSFWEQNCYFNYMNDLWQRPLVNNGHYFWVPRVVVVHREREKFDLSLFYLRNVIKWIFSVELIS